MCGDIDNNKNRYLDLMKESRDPTWRRSFLLELRKFLLFHERRNRDFISKSIYSYH